ncbi:hypothetical protein N656DRAFT_779571 [Canariomyces notabilis]|uniref:Uncharacterized protein n=1 Tax=Canariomyces notabilis TaxID=2074819 RepID=A0AAN6TCW6_9PEZI|nr:hypothetical protein N656DRAFT_779571 [Canariomyces arenarius]
MYGVHTRTCMYMYATGAISCYSGLVFDQPRSSRETFSPASVHCLLLKTDPIRIRPMYLRNLMVKNLQKK